MPDSPPIEVTSADVPTVGTPPARDSEIGAAPASMGFDERYEPRRALGEGGMGAVTLTRDRYIGRLVAMKELRGRRARNAELQRRFVREAKVQGRLEHPSIVPVYDLMRRPDGSHAFSMRAVEGETLADVIEGLELGYQQTLERFPLHRLLEAFRSICLAVAYAHQSSVVHRDLKPDNIMFGDFGEVYVLDWGIAKRVSTSRKVTDIELSRSELEAASTEASSSMVGTPGYMAPEQLADANLVGPWSDIYALGCLLFEMTARAPLNGTGTPKERIAATLREDREAERDMPPELERICLRATAFQPADRYHSARALAEAVDLYLAGQRDTDLRRRLSVQHVDKAASAMRDANGVAQRKEAMRQLGRALALDPENEDAVRMFVEHLATPPSELPRDAHPATDADRRRGFRVAARYAIGVHLSFFMLAPLLAWASEPTWWMAAMAFFALVATGLSWAIAAGRDSERMVVMMMLTSTICLAFVAGAFGPLLVAPFMVAVNVCVYCTLLRRRARRLCLLTGICALVVPCALELAGITHSYAFGESGLVVMAQGAPLTAVPTLVFLVLASLGGILGGGMSCSLVRDALERAERKLRMQTWHLQQALPGLDTHRDPS